MGQFYFPAVVQSALISQGCSAIIQDHALVHPGAVQSSARMCRQPMGQLSQMVMWKWSGQHTCGVSSFSFWLATSVLACLFLPCGSGDGVIPALQHPVSLVWWMSYESIFAGNCNVPWAFTVKTDVGILKNLCLSSLNSDVCYTECSVYSSNYFWEQNKNIFQHPDRLVNCDSCPD